MNLWTRLGVSVSFSALFYIFMAEFLQRSRSLDGYKWHLSLGLAGLGLVLCLPATLGRRQQRERQRPPAFFSLRFCGCLLMIFGVIGFVIVPAKGGRLMAAARTPVHEANAPAVQALPEVRLQGVIYKLSRPSVVINGRPFFVGDTVCGARIVEIRSNGVTLAFNGVEKSVPLLESSRFQARRPTAKR